MKAFDQTRPLIAAAATGIAQRALEEATRYAQERKVCGGSYGRGCSTPPLTPRTPPFFRVQPQTMGKAIIEHQAVAFMLADMAIGAEAARGLVWKSAWMKDAGERN